MHECNNEFCMMCIDMEMDRLFLLCCCMLYNASPVLLMDCEAAVSIYQSK